MAAEWISRLKGHTDLVQSLVQEVPRALARPSLTLEQVERLHAVIEKGVRDFEDVLQTMDQMDADEQYREVAESLARTWLHLQNEAENKLRSMSETEPSPERVRDEDISQANDNDEEDRADVDNPDKT